MSLINHIIRHARGVAYIIEQPVYALIPCHLYTLDQTIKIYLCLQFVPIIHLNEQEFILFSFSSTNSRNPANQILL
jgi:hypothetical protein